MKTLTLIGLLVVGCTAGPAAVPPIAAPSIAAPSVAAPAVDVASPAPPTGTPSASLSVEPRSSASAPEPATTEVAPTAGDEEVAALIKAGVETAVPQLRSLNDLDPSKLQDLFVPLGAWITDQISAVEAYDAGTCSGEAVTLYVDGLDAYDDIRQTFLAWKDWGAHGRPFPAGSPREIAATLEKALAELEVDCAT
jgi:hypothetical protein